MAVVLGTYIVDGNLKNLNDYALGLTIPLQMGTNTFNQSYTTLDALKSNIKNLLLTKRGERLGQPDFGSGLHELLFEMNDDSIQDKIYDAINGSISRWIPQVTVQSIEVTADNDAKDRNQVNVSIYFTAAYTNETFSVDFNMKS